jgi:hypothetical protein
MLNKRCNVTLCQQIIRLVGNQIVVSGGSTIWCGNQSVPVTSVTPTPIPTIGPEKEKLALWEWVAIGVAIFLVAVVMPIAAILYTRSYKKKSADIDQTPPDFTIED